jgi:hypothetical protein
LRKERKDTRYTYMDKLRERTEREREVRERGRHTLYKNILRFSQND